MNSALVTDIFPAQITSPNWTCSSGPNPDTKCGAFGTGNINDTVNLAAGESVTYTINATISPSAAGVLSNTATVSLPPGYIESDTSNNSATDSNTPTGPIGAVPDGTIYTLNEPSVLTLNMPISTSGNSNPDFVYYEYVNGPAVYMDWVQIQIGDGVNWWTVFNWGDNLADTNTNMNINRPELSSFGSMELDDVQGVPGSVLYMKNGIRSGITVDIDAIVPSGTYSYMKIIAPPGGNSLEIDGIGPWP